VRLSTFRDERVSSVFVAYSFFPSDEIPIALRVGGLPTPVARQITVAAQMDRLARHTTRGQSRYPRRYSSRIWCGVAE